MRIGPYHVRTLIAQKVFDIVAKIEIVIENRNLDEIMRGRLLFAHAVYASRLVTLPVATWGRPSCLRAGLGPAFLLPHAALGNTTSSDAPPSGRLLAEIVPPCCVIIPSATVKPSPVTFASRRVETNASNKFGSTCCGMPGPLSCTSQQIQFWPPRRITFDSTRIRPPAGIAIRALRRRFTNT